MATDLTDLDHVMICCADHDVVANRLHRMGFRIRPVRQFAVMGGGAAGGMGGSQLVLLRSARPGGANYLEFSVCDHRFAQPAMRDLLGGPEGIAIAAHQIGDFASVEARWSALGYPMERWSFEMPAVGASPAAEVRILLPHAGALPWPMNAVLVTDMQQYSIPELQDHPNTAQRMHALTYIVPPERRDDIVAAVSAFYDAPPLHDDVFRIGETELRLMSPDLFEARYPGMNGDNAPPLPRGGAVTIVVKDLELLRKALVAGDIPHRAVGDALLVDRTTGGGVVFDFVAA